MEDETHTFTKGSRPPAGLVNFIGNLAVNRTLKLVKKGIYYAMYRNIADMEPAGVYFVAKDICR